MDCGARSCSPPSTQRFNLARMVRWSSCGRSRSHCHHTCASSRLNTAAAAKNEPSKLKAVFEKVSTGVHTQKDGVKVPCSYYKCTQPNCKSRGEMIKEINWAKSSIGAASIEA